MNALAIILKGEELLTFFCARVITCSFVDFRIEFIIGITG